MSLFWLPQQPDWNASLQEAPSFTRSSARFPIWAAELGCHCEQPDLRTRIRIIRDAMEKPHLVIPALPCLILLLLALASPARAQTIVNVDPTTTLRAYTQKPGANMGTPTNYDSGIMYKNLLLPANVGGEGAMLQQIWQGQAGASPLSTTQFNSNNSNAQYDQAPENWWKGGNFNVIQSCGANSESCSGGGAELDCSSTIIANTKAGTSPSGAAYTFSPACASPIAPGDVIVLKQTFAPLTETQLTTGGWGAGISEANGGHISEETTDVCEGCGASSYKMDLTAGGQASAMIHFQVDHLDAGGTVVNMFRRISGTYVLKFMAKQVSGSTTLSVQASRSGGFNCGPYRAVLTPQWAQFKIICQATEGIMKQENSGIQVEWIGRGGGVVYLDNLDFEQDPATTDPANSTIFSDQYVNALKIVFATGTPGNPGTLRYNPAPSSETLDSWLLPLYARMMTNEGVDRGFYSSASSKTSLQDFLHLCQVVGVDPLIILPITFTEADSKELVDFLYGGPKTVYGAKRIALGGPSAPGGYASIFKVIHLALGNENWNGGFTSQAIGWRQGTDSPSQDYTSRFNTLATDMRATPSYVSARTELVIGVQTAGAGAYMSNIATHGHPDAIEIEQYTQGSVSDYSTNALLFTPAFAEAYVNMNQPDSAHGVYQSYKAIQAQHTCGANHATQCKVNIYEENNAGAEGSAPQSAMNGFANGGAYGVIMFNQFLQSMQTGNIMTQDFFALTGYFEYQGSKYLKLFGAAIDYGGACSFANSAIFGGNFCPRPTMLSLQLANNLVIGKMIGCSISGATGAAPFDLPPNHNGVNAQKNVPTIYAYCFESAADPNQYAVAIVNESLTTSYPITWAGKATPTKGVKRMRLAPANPFDTNEAPANWVTNTAVAKVSLATATGLNIASGDVVPPDSVSVYLYSTGVT